MRGHVKGEVGSRPRSEPTKQKGVLTWKFQGREMPSSSVASSGLVTRELLDAERFLKVEILRKKPDFVLAGLLFGSGEGVEVEIERGGDCWRERLGAGEGQRTERAAGGEGFPWGGLAEEMEMREGLMEEE